MKFCLSWHEVIRQPQPSLPEYQPPVPMKQTDSIIEALSQLTELDATRRRLEVKSPRYQEIALELESVRERLPTAILSHYDQRVSRGKRGAARVRNNTCGGCHLLLPSGQLSDMRRAEVALQICGNCSTLLLPEDPKPEDAMPVMPAEPEPETAPKPKKRKKSATAS
ncbi:hypothetical protein [Prosthecobacter sp.]|uniref:hypothetical protein n=1 Tax=Prosthecobacter sp. TaxID=1965333 RepID=UPI002488537B|nr:hypothetical protein [Prosthecobacter sp.]MDI1313829.1 hypothetical protein [Prosthecobacter sp.]